MTSAMAPNGWSWVRSNTSRRIAFGRIGAVGQHDARAVASRRCFSYDASAATGSSFSSSARGSVRARIQNSLAGAVGTARHHRMRGVAEPMSPAPKLPARQRILVDHRKFEHTVGGANERGDIEPIEMPVGERADEIVDRTGPVSSRGLR